MLVLVSVRLQGIEGDVVLIGNSVELGDFRIRIVDREYSHLVHVGRERQIRPYMIVVVVIPLPPRPGNATSVVNG
jgi:hypothetical protein